MPTISGSPAPEDHVGGIEDRGELAAGNAHHVADDQQRERLRHRLDQVHLPFSQMPSTTSVQTRSTESSTPPAVAGVNDRATMPRWRAWRGSSITMNDPRTPSPPSGRSGRSSV